MQWYCSLYFTAVAGLSPLSIGILTECISSLLISKKVRYSRKTKKRVDRCRDSCGVSDQRSGYRIPPAEISLHAPHPKSYVLGEYFRVAMKLAKETEQRDQCAMKLESERGPCCASIFER